MGPIEKLRMIGGLAFGIGDSRGVGLAAGVVLGLLLGPLVAIFGGSLGLDFALLSRVTGGVVLGVGVAVAVWLFGGSVLSTADRATVAIGGGVAVGAIGGVGLGVAAPVVDSFGAFTVRVVGSLALGVVAGVTLGGLAGQFAAVFGGAEPEDVEEFDVSELTDTDVVTAMMEEFRQFSPGGAAALIDERDAFIAHKLVALRQSGADVVAVVGAGHREGIERYLDNPNDLPPMASLTGTGGSGIPWAKLVGTGISVVVVGFFVLLALSSAGDATLLRLFGAWFLVNGLFAAGLAKVAGARWTSSLVGGAVAWMTSINPFLAPGWFAGYVELQYNPVNVSDIGTLNEIIADEDRPIPDLVSDLFGVPLFRLIMIVAATNVGSIVASALFVAYLLPLFALDLGGAAGVTRLLFEGARNGWEILWGTVA
jgi:pheromone shutdown protein TraB